MNSRIWTPVSNLQWWKAKPHWEKPERRLTTFNLSLKEKHMVAITTLPYHILVTLIRAKTHATNNMFGQSK